MVVYLSKPIIMRINHMLGYQGWEDLEWWTCAREKENYDHKAPMMSSLSDCTWLEKELKFRLSTTWHPSLHFIFLFSFTWSIPLISLLLPHLSLFLFHIFFSFILIYVFYSHFFLSFFLSFPYSYFSLYFSLSRQLFKALNSLFLACIQSEILNNPC
jgi:hypothetical protein